MHLRWKQHCQNYSADFLKRDLLLKGRGGGKFFPFKADPFSEGDWCEGKQTGDNKNVSIEKKAENLPCVSIHLKPPVSSLYCIYPKYSDTSTPYHTCFKI